MKNLVTICFCVAMAFFSCSNTSQESKKNKSPNEIIGLASIIQLEPESTKVHLEDYFLNVQNISSVKCEGLEVQLSNDKTTLDLKGVLPSQLGFIEVETKSKNYVIPVKASSKMTAKISIPKEMLEGKEVKVKGSFNAWNPNAGIFKLINGNWVHEMIVKKGAYEYKLVVDGSEKDDPSNSVKVSNGFGGFNNILQVGEPEVLNLLQTKSYSDNQVIFGTEIGVSKAIATLNNQELQTEVEGTEVMVTLPESGYSGYSSLRVWAEFEGQASNDVLVPLYNGKVISEASSIKREDMHSAIMYFVMLDRFVDGNKENNFPIDDDRILPIANNFGGDMTGLNQKINQGYFEDLGVNTLWLSPITTNPDSAYGLWNKEVESMFSGYHGYWPIRSKEIDYRLGSDSEFKNLLNSAHSKDMNVLLDYVANHVHIEHPVFQEHPDWATDLYLPDGTMNTEKWDEHRLTTWFDTHLATLDLRRPEVVNPMVDTAMYWLSEFELDGFRHDATKHIDELFWRTLTKRIKNEVIIGQNRAFYQVGETYGSPELVSSYVESGQLDAQFDFNLYDAAIDAFAKKETGFQNLERVLLESIKYHGAHHTMVNITGNQDKPRFASLADGSVRFDEDSKLAGWTREINNDGEEGFRRMEMMLAFLHSIPGIPCVYYGDEIAMPGGNDPDNRRMMVFNNLNQSQEQVKKKLKSLTDLRSNSMALIYGSTKIIEASDDMLQISRTYFNKETRSIFYKGDEEIEYTLPTADFNFAEVKSLSGVELREVEDQIVCVMKPESFVIFEIEIKK